MTLCRMNQKKTGVEMLRFISHEEETNQRTRQRQVPQGMTLSKVFHHLLDVGCVQTAVLMLNSSQQGMGLNSTFLQLS